MDDATFPIRSVNCGGLTLNSFLGTEACRVQLRDLMRCEEGNNGEIIIDEGRQIISIPVEAQQIFHERHPTSFHKRRHPSELGSLGHIRAQLAGCTKLATTTTLVNGKSKQDNAECA
jgi:hypothetical protein